MLQYEDYTWSELEAASVTEYFEALGWNSSSWDKEIDYSPPSDNQDWDELSLEEQNAAAELCYFQELWDGIPIPEWEDYGSGFSCPDDAMASTEANATATDDDATESGAWDDVSGTVVTDVVDTYEATIADPDPAEEAAEEASENTLEPGAVEAAESTAEPVATEGTAEPVATLSPCVVVAKKGKKDEGGPPSWWNDNDGETTVTESPSEPCAELLEPAKDAKKTEAPDQPGWWGDAPAANATAAPTDAPPAGVGKKGEEGDDTPSWWTRK